MYPGLGTPWVDCFRFNALSSLDVDGLGPGQTQTFSQDFNGNSPVSWQSTSRAGAVLPTAFHGIELDATTMRGNAINQFGATFVFIVEDPDCTSDFTQAGYYIQ